MGLRPFLLVATIFHICGSFPIAGVCLEYNPSEQYLYTYTTHVAIGGAQASAPARRAYSEMGFRLDSDVTLAPVWKSKSAMVIKLMISNAKLQSMSKSSESGEVRSLSSYPFYIQLEGSRITSIYSSSRDAAWSVAIKAGVASLLQLQTESGERTEVDMSGTCHVTYTAKSNKITKQKTGCHSNGDTHFRNINPLLDVNMTSTNILHYELHDNVIHSVTSSERHISRVNMKEDLVSSIDARQELLFKKSTAGSNKVQASGISDVVTALQKTAGVLTIRDFDVLLKDMCTEGEQTNTVTNLGKQVSRHHDALLPAATASTKTASIFVELVGAFRTSTQGIKDVDRKTKAILKVLRHEGNADIVSTLIDIVVAAQTEAGQKAMMSLLDFTDTYDISLPERYLLATAFTTHPSQRVLQDLLGLYKAGGGDAQLKDSVGSTLGAVLYTFSRLPGNHDSHIVQEIQSAVVEGLDGCGTDAGCACAQLRCLGNAGLPSSLHVLLKQAEHASSAVVSESAIRALRRLDLSLLKTEQVKSTLTRIFHQERRGYDSTVRSAALAVLLKTQPSAEQIKDIVESTTDPDNTEMDMFVQETLATAADADENIREKYLAALRNPDINNYNILAPKGKALAFKENMAEVGQLKATYDMYVHNSKASIMKRSGMDVNLLHPSQSLPLYSFGIFAAGLDGMLGEEVEAGQEDVEPTAGLALNLIDVSLRPVTFFTGQSGLMSAVWSAPSSLVSALQANVLLQDNHQTIPLANGFIVNHTLQGAISMDLSGFISISLWNKNCNSLIKNSGAIFIKGSTSISTAVMRAGMSYTAEADSVINFQTDVDFYDGIKMCLQMYRPGLVYRHTVEKHERANAFKKTYAATIRRSRKVNPASYPLPKPNNKQCRALLGQQT